MNRIQVHCGLFFEYELRGGRRSIDVFNARVEVTTGVYIPFKQRRLIGQVNPLKPPVHVETVLIGRALDQETGYLYGIGYRILDDGSVEAEFANGPAVFNGFPEFEAFVISRLRTSTEEP